MTTPAPVSDGKTLGIVGLVLAFVFSIAGLIVSIIARNQSKAAGVPNGPATAGIILSIIFLVLGVVFAIIYVVFIGTVLSTGAYNYNN
jgi:hypothetical protein